MIEFSFISFSLFETKIATLVRTLFSLRLSLSLGKRPNDERQQGAK
jgi:hypothetical protein